MVSVVGIAHSGAAADVGVNVVVLSVVVVVVGMRYLISSNNYPQR